MRRSLGVKIIVFLLTCLFLCAFAACTNTENSATPSPDPGTDPNAPSANEYTVAIYNGVNVTIDRYLADTVVTATAEEIGGKVFVCWNHNGQIYSFDKNLTYTVDQNSVFKAVYSVNSYVELDAGDGVMKVTDIGTVLKSSTQADRVRPVFGIGGTPEIVGVVAATKTLSVELSALTGNCTSFVYAWQRSDSQDGGYADIAGATGAEYALTSEDVGKFIRVAVTGTSGYEGTVFSAPTPRIATAAAVSSALELTSSGTSGNKTIAKKASLVLIEGYYYSLPVPTKDYYTFVGWYDGDKQITDGNGSSKEAAAGTLSLTARFVENGKVFVHSYRSVDGATVFADKDEYYLEEGAVYLTAEAIEDHECVVWEESARYNPITAQPADWSVNYDRYYVLDGDTYVLNGSAVWSASASYAYLGVGGRFIAEKPSDWETSYERYYVANLSQNTSDFWYETVRFRREYVPLLTRPADWDARYGSYYAAGEDGYVPNTSSEWKDRTYYYESYFLVKEIPADWATSYTSYYNADFVLNTSDSWETNKVYWDFRLSEEKNPSLMTVLLTGMKEKTQIECVAVYREAYRVSVSGGMGSGYYVADDDIPLRAIVTAGKAFDKWSVVRDGVTYYPVRYGENGGIALAYAIDGETYVVRYADNIGVLQTAEFFVANTVADFGAGKYNVFFYRLLTEKPDDWQTAYAGYYVYDNGNYERNANAEWGDGVDYYEKVTAENKFFKKTYVLLDKRPADWDEKYETYFALSGITYVQNDDSRWMEDTYYRVSYIWVKEEPDDWATEYGSYYTTTASFLSATDKISLSDLSSVGLAIGGGCKVVAEFAQTDYVLRYELNLNVGGNRISDDNPAVKTALNEIGFFDNDDGVFVYNQLLHYNDTIPWVVLPGVTHYGFNGWQLASGGQRPTTMPRLSEGEVLTVVGTFSAEKYLITVLSGANGTARIGSTTGVESGYYSYGDSIRIFVTANAGYQLDNWTYGEGKVLTVGAGQILSRFADDDTSEETIIYYFSYKITGDASDDDKTIKCNFTEREYEIIYRINYIYDDEDVTGEDRFNSSFVPMSKGGLDYTLESTRVQYYRIYYSAGGQVVAADLNAAMKYIGLKYVYNGLLSGDNVDLARSETALINRLEYYKLPVVDENGGQAYILCYTYAGTSRMEYVSETAETYRVGLLGRSGYAVTAKTSALYRSQVSIAEAPTAQELNLPYTSDAVYWRFSDWSANYGEANQNPTAFAMPMRPVIVTGSFIVSQYTLSLSMGGLGANAIRYVTVNGRDPSYYGDGLELEIPYASDVVVEYSLKTGFFFTQITYVSQVGQSKTVTCGQSGSDYVYSIDFSFTSGEDATYTFGSYAVKYRLDSYLRVDRENEETTEYLLGAAGLNVDFTRYLEINGYTYYLFRSDAEMLFEDILSDHIVLPSSSLLSVCNYAFNGWAFTYHNGTDYVSYSQSRMPDRNLIAYTTLNINVFTVDVPTDVTYEFDPIGTDTGVYMTSAPVSYATTGSSAPAYDYYTAFDLSYILPLGYHFDGWTVTNSRTGQKTDLQAGAYFRRSFERLSARPSDWATQYAAYYVLQDGIYVLNSETEDASTWNPQKEYYSFSGMESVRFFPDNRVQNSDVYVFCSYVVNTDTTWRADGNSFYAQTAYIPIAAKPSDWETAYGEYYIENAGVYTKNASSEWDGSASYYYVGLVRVMTQPADFTQNHRSYYKVTPSSYRYIIKQNEYEGEYYRYRMEDLTACPADWATAYASYFVKSGDKYVRNVSSEWEEGTTYARAIGLESVVGSAGVTEDADRYGLYIRVGNVDPLWDDGIVYVKLDYVALAAQPSDWATAYASYFVKEGGDYVLNASSTWDNGKEYAYLGYVSVGAQPADWDAAYTSYYRLVEAPTWYTPGETVTITDLKLFTTANIRIEGKFSKNTFRAEVKVVGGTPDFVYIAQTGKTSTNEGYVYFEYSSTLSVSFNADGVVAGSKIVSIDIYQSKNDGQEFDLTEYAAQKRQSFDPVLNISTYEYGVTGFTTSNYIDNIYIVVMLESIQYEISYVLYTDLDSLADLSEDNKITLSLSESVTEGAFFDLKSKFRIGYSQLVQLNGFLSSNEVLNLLTNEQIAAIGGGERSDLLVVNWFLAQPTASTTQSNILSSYRHTNKSANLVLYGLLLNLFRVQTTSNEVAVGFNKYVTDSFDTVYERNIASLVVPTTYAGRDVTRYGFTSAATGEQYYFAGSGKIETLSFGPQLRYVSVGAFENCSFLTTVTMEEGVRSIGDNAFKGCSSLATVDFPVSLVNIGEKAFSGTALTSVTIDNVLPVGYTDYRVYGAEAFSEIPTLSEVHFNANSKPADTYQTTQFTGSGIFRNSGSAVLAGVTLYVGECVVFLDSNLFGYKQGQDGNGRYLKTVVIEDGTSTLEIPEGAFRSTGLLSVTIGSRVSSLAQNTFRECTELAEVIFTEDCTLTSIADSCFFFCTSLQEIVLPATLVSIGRHAFAGTSSLTSVYYKPYGATVRLAQIGENAFGRGENGSGTLSARSGLKRFLPVSQKETPGNTVEIPVTVTSIGKSAFAYSTIERLILGGNNLTIGQRAFFDLAETTQSGNVASLSYLEYNVSGTVTIDCPTSEQADIFALSPSTAVGGSCEVVITQNTSQIPARFFKNMSSASTLTIGSYVTTIGEEAFAGMSGLTVINYNAANVTGTTDATSAFLGSGNDATVVFGKSVKNLPDYLFNGASGILSLDFSRVTSSDSSASLTIGTRAFNGMSAVVSLSLPKMYSLTLKDGALLGMSKLRYLTIAQDIGTFSVGVNSINIDTRFTTLSFPGYSYTNQSTPLEVTEGTFVTTYDGAHYHYTLSANSTMKARGMGSTMSAFNVPRGDEFLVVGTFRLYSDLYVYGKMNISTEGGHVIRENEDVLYKIYGCVYSELDLTDKNASDSVYTHLKQMDSFTLTGNTDLSVKTEYHLTSGSTLTVGAGVSLSIDRSFICDGDLSVGGSLLLYSKDYMTLNGNLVVAANAAFSVGEKVYISGVSGSVGMYIESGNVSLYALASSADHTLTPGIGFTVNGRAYLLSDFTFGSGDVLDIASGSRLTLNYDLTAGTVYTNGELIVNKSVSMSKQNAFYQAGGTTYDTLPDGGSGAVVGSDVTWLVSSQQGHGCQTQTLLYRYGITAKMKDVTEKLKATRKETETDVYAGLICGTLAEQETLLTKAARSADVIFDQNNNLYGILPLYACVYTGEEVTSVDSSAVVGYIKIQYGLGLGKGKLVCPDCGQELAPDVTTVYNGDTLRTAVEHEKSLLKLSGSDAPVYFGFTDTTTFGDIDRALSSSSFGVYYSNGYAEGTLVSGMLGNFGVLYGAYDNGRSYYLIPIGTGGGTSPVGFLAATYEVTFDANITASVKEVSSSTVKYYGTLDYAMAKITAGTVLLLTEEYNATTISLNKSVTLDLNGYDLRLTGNEELITIGESNSPTVTIRGGNVVADGSGGTLFSVENGALTLEGGEHSYSGLIFSVSDSASISVSEATLTGTKLMDACGNASLDLVTFSGTEGITVYGGAITVRDCFVTTVGTALAVDKTAEASASLSVGSLSRGSELVSTDGIAVRVERKIASVNFEGSEDYSVNVRGKDAAVMHGAGTLTLERYVIVTATEGRSNDVSVLTGAIVLNEPEGAGASEIVLAVKGTGVYIINSGADHDAILHYNRRSDLLPVLNFVARPNVVGLFTELTTFSGENNNSDAIYTKAQYVFPIYTRQEISDVYAYLTYTDSLKTALQVSYSPNASAQWDNDKHYATRLLFSLSSKPDNWDTRFADYYLDIDGTIKNTSPEWLGVGNYYYAAYNEVLTKPSNWDSNYQNYFVLDSKAVCAYIPNDSSVWDSTKEYYDGEHNLISECPEGWATEYASYFVGEWKATYVFTSGNVAIDENTIVPMGCVLKTSAEVVLNADLTIYGEIIVSDDLAVGLAEDSSSYVSIRIGTGGKLTLTGRNKKIGKNTRYEIDGELIVTECGVTVEDNAQNNVDKVITVGSTGKIIVGGTYGTNNEKTAYLYFAGGRIGIEGTLTNNGNVVFYSATRLETAADSDVVNANSMTFNGKATINGALTSSGSLNFKNELTVSDTGSIECTDSSSGIELISNAHVYGSIDMGGSTLVINSSVAILFYNGSVFSSEGDIDCYGEMTFCTESVTITGNFNFFLGALLIAKSDIFTNIEGRMTLETVNEEYATLPSKPVDWDTEWTSYYSAPGVALTGLVCPTWNDGYYYRTVAYPKKTTTISLKPSGSLAVTAMHGYSLQWSPERVETTCVRLGYTHCGYTKTVGYDNAGFRMNEITFADSGAVHWDCASEYVDHVVEYVPSSAKTELGHPLTHGKRCRVCLAELGEEEHVLSGLTIGNEATPMEIGGEPDTSHQMVGRTCIYCGQTLLSVYQCAYDTTVGDINAYISSTGFACSISGATPSDLIHDKVSAMEYTESFDTTKYYLFPVSKGSQKAYILLWYDYDYEYVDVAGSNYHAKQWTDHEGYYSYEQHTYTSISTVTIIRNHESYFVADGSNYVTASYIYISSGTQYYSRSSVTTTGPCYVKVAEDTYELATEGGADKYYLYSNGDYVEAPTNYYTDNGSGTYVKVEYWTAAGITYYTFATTSVGSSARQNNVLTGECSVCHKDGPIIFYYDQYTTTSDLRTYLGSNFTVNNLTSSGTVTIEGVAYSVLSVRQGYQTRYVLGLQQTGHQLYYNWLNADEETHEGFCGDCTSSSGNVGAHTLTSTAKYINHNHSLAGKVKFDNILAYQCLVCGNYFVWCLDADDDDSFDDLSALIAAAGYSVFVNFSSSDLVSAHLSGLEEYVTLDNCYLVPICETGGSSATGYVVVKVTHAFEYAYANVTHHNKTCSVCGYQEKETHKVGETTKDANGLLGYICSDCGQFIPYHIEMDHLNTIGDLNVALDDLKDGLSSKATVPTEKFYQYMDRSSFGTCSLTLDYYGNVVTLSHVKVPVNGYEDGSYVAVYFVPHETMHYESLGADTFEGFFTTRHSALCSGCGKSYEENHVFNGTYQLYESAAWGISILSQVCVHCGQVVAVTYTFGDGTTYGEFDALLAPCGYTYYKASSLVSDTYSVARGQFYGKGGDYNRSIDKDNDGMPDYYIVEISLANNNTQRVGYVLVKFLHHLKYDLFSEEGADTMVCNDCGYTITLGHRIAEDRLSIARREDANTVIYHYDTADEMMIGTETLRNLVALDSKENVLLFCFGPETTCDDVTQYFVGALGWNLAGSHVVSETSEQYYMFHANGYMYRIYSNSRKVIDCSASIQCFYENEFYYGFPLNQVECSFGYNSVDGYVGTVETYDTERPAYYLLAKYDENAPKDGYFVYFSGEQAGQTVTVTSYRELVTSQRSDTSITNGKMYKADPIEMDKVYLRMRANGDEGTIYYVVGFETTLADVENDLEEFTYWHNGEIGVTTTDNLAILISSYLYENYYLTRMKDGHFLLPLAYKSNPTVWATNLLLEFNVTVDRKVENIYLQKEQSIESVDAFFINMKCELCDKPQYQALHVTEGIKFSDLDMFRYITLYISETAEGNSSFGFTPADWDTYYYVNGCTADSLLIDKNVPKAERYYHVLDTMEYGSNNRQVSLLYLGTKEVTKLDEEGNAILDENDEPVVIDLPVYFLIQIEDDEII